MEKDSKIGLIMFLIICMTFIICIVGIFVQKRDVLVKETDEYLYYKEYKIYNLDSGIYKYHKPIIYDGYVNDKYTTHGFVGVPGKGGHSVTYYHLIIQYDGKNYEERGSDIYDKFNKGEKIQVIEKFYPSYEIILNKY